MRLKQKQNLAAVVDELGRVKARMSDDEAKYQELRDKLIQAGIDEAEGKLFRATVSKHDRVQVDYRTVVDHLKQTPKLKALLEEFTKTEERVTVKIVSR